MGCAMSKRCAELREESRALRAKIHAMEEELREARRERDREARARGRREAAKHGEWKQERRRHREEVGALEKRLVEEETRRRALEEVCCAAAAVGGDGVDEELRRASAWRLVEQLKAEQARREQAVDKWKQLYLAIKAELDALILQTKQGERLCWVAEENVMERLHRELKAKEETIVALRSRLEAAGMEGGRREREADILRQSLRILSSNKKNHGRKSLVRCLRSRSVRRGLQPVHVTCSSLRT